MKFSYEDFHSHCTMLSKIILWYIIKHKMNKDIFPSRSAPGENFTPSCGACRQFMAEFGDFPGKKFLSLFLGQYNQLQEILSSKLNYTCDIFDSIQLFGIKMLIICRTPVPCNSLVPFNQISFLHKIFSNPKRISNVIGKTMYVMIEQLHTIINCSLNVENTLDSF